MMYCTGLNIPVYNDEQEAGVLSVIQNIERTDEDLFDIICISFYHHSQKAGTCVIIIKEGDSNCDSAEVFKRLARENGWTEVTDSPEIKDWAMACKGVVSVFRTPKGMVYENTMDPIIKEQFSHGISLWYTGHEASSPSKYLQT